MDREHEHHAEHQVHQRSGERHEAADGAGTDRAVLDPHRSTGQWDTTEEQEHERQDEAESDIGVLADVECEIALRAYGVVAAAIGDDGVPELVYAQ